MSDAGAPTPPEPGRLYSRVESRDFDEIALAMAGLDTDFRQLSRGAFRGEVELVALGPLRVMRIAVNRVIQARGAIEPDKACFSLITPTNEGASWRGRTRKRGDINVNSPSSEVDHLSSREYDSLTIVADIDHLRSAGDSLLGIDVGPYLRGSNGLGPTPQSFATLEGVARGTLDLTRSRPEFLESPQGRALIEETLTRNLVNALAGRPTLAEDAPVQNRQRVAQRAEEFMLANLRSSPLMTSLCEELDVSERTLRYAFHDRFGVSPRAYFEMLRLNAIRRQIAETRAEVGVQEAARQWGVVHLGNFAADYRRLFGEAPSQTARRVRGTG